MSTRILEHIGNHHYIGNYVVPEVDFLISRAYSAVKEFNQTGNKSAFLKVLLVANQIKYLAAQYDCWGESGNSKHPVSKMWGNRNLFGEAILYAFSDFFMEIENKTVIAEKKDDQYNPKDTGIAHLNYASHLDNLLKKWQIAYFSVYDIDRFIRFGWNSSERWFNEFGFMPFDLNKLLPQEIYKRMYACLKCFDEMIGGGVIGYEIFLHMAKKKEADDLPQVFLTLDNRFGGWTDVNFSHLPIMTIEFPQEETARKKSVYFGTNDQHTKLIYELPTLVEEYRRFFEQDISEIKTYENSRSIYRSPFNLVEWSRRKMTEKMMGRVRYTISGNPYLYVVYNGKLVFYSIPEMVLLEADYLLQHMVKRN